MSHDLDTTDGRTSFVSANTMGWHQLGQLLPESFTAEEAMEHGLLGGWDVRKWPALATDPTTGLQIPKPGRVDLVRNNPVTEGQIDWLGEVSEGYGIVQNEEHAELLNALVDESGAHFDTAGALDGGRKVFITMKLPGHITIGGVDQVDNYLAAVNSHDGSMSFTLMVTPVRIVCANTLNCAFGNNSHLFRMRHNSGIRKAIHTQAREALDMTFNYLDGFQAEAEQMIQTAMTQAQFEKIISREFDRGGSLAKASNSYGVAPDASEATLTRTERKLAEIGALFAEGETQAGVRDTAWAGFNALTEWADHHAPVRKTNELRLAEKAVMHPQFKEAARKLMMAAV